MQKCSQSPSYWNWHYPCTHNLEQSVSSDSSCILHRSRGRRKHTGSSMAKALWILWNVLVWDKWLLFQSLQYALRNTCSLSCSLESSSKSFGWGRSSRGSVGQAAPSSSEPRALGALLTAANWFWVPLCIKSHLPSWLLLGCAGMWASALIVLSKQCTKGTTAGPAPWVLLTPCSTGALPACPLFPFGGCNVSISQLTPSCRALGPPWEHQ